MSAARHRAGGFGRVVAFRTPAPRHAAPAPSDAPTLGAAVAMLLGPVVGGLAAVAVPAHENPPALPPLPRPVASRPVPAAWVPRQGVPHTSKVRFPVLLGLLPHNRLTWYCRRTYGPHSTAALFDGDWSCRPRARRGLIDMNAVCQWRFGEDGWAGMTNDNDPTTWRCYRDPS